ncbi:hypothetical protein QFZ75_005264 [Streptomyces sp. V3I8]|uniref:hypothetical protein n=1 Tax=Streptomyces sp. V3I8 TaxID=3042279 RepID=UPI00277E879B|nr:hypothetical protein [Streptomyces sp. V3I8]MDQ1038848.1 hypothetical protein [Streptomyces sp. V3I8]
MAAPDAVAWSGYVLLYVLWAAALAHSIRAHRKEKALEAAACEEREAAANDLPRGPFAAYCAR